MSLSDYGWNDEWAARLTSSGAPGATPARVVAEHRGSFEVHTGSAVLPAQVSGRLRHRAARGELPAVGDWVGVDLLDDGAAGVIRTVLPRLSRFSRRAAGTRTDEQVLAANVDTVWIVSALGPDFNAARLERYLTLAWESGARPAIVLTKADLVEAPEQAVAELGTRVIGVGVHAVSAVSGAGVEPLYTYLGPGQTIALLGSSGAGKSTLLNRLAGSEVMRVAAVREGDGKGRHTTTHRQLVRLPSGALLLDTPGMRELQLWSADAGLQATFEDIEALAAACSFTDCRHETEPRCAVRAAIDAGDLAPEHLFNYQKLQRELAFLARKRDARLEAEAKREIKRIMKHYRRTMQDKE